MIFLSIMLLVYPANSIEANFKLLLVGTSTTEHKVVLLWHF